MLYGKTMKFFVFLDPSIVIFPWQYKFNETCILPYLEIDLGLEIPSIKGNNRLLYLYSLSTWNPKTRPRTAIVANVLLFHLRGL